jgi:hypothetical protein
MYMYITFFIKYLICCIIICIHKIHTLLYYTLFLINKLINLYYILQWPPRITLTTLFAINVLPNVPLWNKFIFSFCKRIY